VSVLVNVINNYKSLLIEYEKASQIYQETGLTCLLAHALENLEKFERKFIELYSLEELLKLNSELGAQLSLVV
jgi:hypothetical protein